MNLSRKEFERRTSDRFDYRGHCAVVTPGDSLTASIINLSEQGALIAILGPHSLRVNDTATLIVELSGKETVQLQARVAHVKEHYVGWSSSPVSKKDQQQLTTFLNSL